MTTPHGDHRPEADMGPVAGGPRWIDNPTTVGDIVESLESLGFRVLMRPEITSVWDPMDRRRRVDLRDDVAGRERHAREGVREGW
jgi:hypothetical protein